MLDRVMGVRLRLTSAQIAALRGSAGSSRVPVPAGARSVALLRLHAARDHAFVEILRTQAGDLFAREVDQSSQPIGSGLAVPLRHDAASPVLREAFAFSGSFADPAPAAPASPAAPVAPASPAAPPTPSTDLIERGTFFPSFTRVTGAAIAARFTSTNPRDHADADRDLSTERFAIRIPTTISPKRPAALLIWIGPGANTSIPPSLHAALDLYNVVAVAPTDATTNRTLTNRVQLALDAVHEASTRAHIDPERVYIAGFSAGASVAASIHYAYPDVFRASILCGGVAFYQSIQVGPSTSWAARLPQPSRANIARLNADRVAIVVGQADPLHEYAAAVASRMSLMSFQARHISVPDLAHALPNADTFIQALEWIDGPAHTQFKDLSALGRDLLAAVDTPPTNSRPLSAQALRARLIEVTRQAPWTPAAWTAVDRLTAPR
jgi:predicted esterase